MTESVSPGPATIRLMKFWLDCSGVGFGQGIRRLSVPYLDAAFGAVRLGADRRVEDDDVADRRVVEVVDEAVDEDPLADVEGRLHRFGGDLVRLDDPGLDRQRQPQGQRNDDDQLDQPAAFALRLRDQRFQAFESSSESPASAGSSSSASSDAESVLSLPRFGRCRFRVCRLSLPRILRRGSLRLRGLLALGRRGLGLLGLRRLLGGLRLGASSGVSTGTTSSWLTPSASTAARRQPAPRPSSSSMPQRRSATRAALPTRPRR